MSPTFPRSATVPQHLIKLWTFVPLLVVDCALEMSWLTCAQEEPGFNLTRYWFWVALFQGVQVTWMQCAAMEVMMQLPVFVPEIIKYQWLGV